MVRERFAIEIPKSPLLRVSWQPENSTETPKKDRHQTKSFAITDFDNITDMKDKSYAKVVR